MPEYQKRPGETMFGSIALHLESEILSGRHSQSEILPPFSTLAREYGVSLPTVRSAIELLIRRGLIEQPRKGHRTGITRTRFAEVLANPQPAGVECSNTEVEPMSLRDMWPGLGWYLLSARRNAIAACERDPNPLNQDRVASAFARELLYSALDPKVNQDPLNPLLERGIMQAFRWEIVTISEHPTLGDALIEAANKV